MDKGHDLDQLQFFVDGYHSSCARTLRCERRIFCRTAGKRSGVPDPLDSSRELAGESFDLFGRLNGVPVLGGSMSR